MTTNVVLEDGASIEVEIGPDDLALYTAEHRWAVTQVRRWERRATVAGKVLEQLQAGVEPDIPEPRGGYSSAFSPIAWHVMVPNDELADIADQSFDREDMVALIRHATGYDFPAIDPGLRGNKPRLWEPTTAMGHVLKDIAYRLPYRTGHIFEQIAEES